MSKLALIYPLPSNYLRCNQNSNPSVTKTRPSKGLEFWETDTAWRQLSYGTIDTIACLSLSSSVTIAAKTALW